MRRLTLALSFVLLLTTQVRAEFIGIKQDEFMKHYQTQQQTAWCWAACASMVLSTQDIKISQDEIVQRLRGVPVNQPGSLMDMIIATNGVLLDANSKEVVVSGQAQLGAPLATVLYNHLKRGKPVVLAHQDYIVMNIPWMPGLPGAPGTMISKAQIAPGSTGHVVVLTGIDATVAAQGGVQIQKLYFFDPFPYAMVMKPGMGPILVEDKTKIYQETTWSSIGSDVIINNRLITSVIFVEGTHK